MDHHDLPPGLSDAQDKLLAVLPIPSSILSVIGSSVIIYMLVQHNRGRRKCTPYTRLLFGMSVCDIISSISIASAGFLRPQESSIRAWAFGNDATCTASGLLIQFSWSGMFYYNMLSFYFLLTTRFGMSNSVISKRIEPFMHLISVGFPLVTGIVGAVMGMYAETSASFGCWVNDYPRGCTGDECKGMVIGFIFYGIPFLISSLTLIFNNIAIFIFVRNQTMASQGSLTETNTQEQTARDTTGNEEEEKFDDPFNNLPSQAVDIAVGDSVAENRSHEPEGSSTSPQNTMSTDEFASKRSASNLQCQQIKRLRLVRTQALLFVMAYALCVTWSALIKFLEGLACTEAEEISLTMKYFPIMVGNAFFAPLTGFLNMAVFLRPKYLRWKHSSPQSRSLRDFWHTLLVANTTRSRRREKRPRALPEVGARKRSDKTSPPPDNNKTGDDPHWRLHQAGISSLTSSGQSAHCMQEPQSGSDRNDGWLSSDSICTDQSTEEFLALNVVSELTSSMFDASSTNGDTNSGKHSSGSNSTLSSHPNSLLVRTSWPPVEERWNPNHSPRIARMSQKGTVLPPFDQIPSTPSRASKAERRISRWSSSRSSSPSEKLDSKLLLPQRVGSDIDHEEEVKVVPNIPTLKPLTESSPPTPSEAKKAPSR